MNKELLDILACPICGGKLIPDVVNCPLSIVNCLTCPACAVRFPVEDGIPVLVPDRAKPLETE